ncbi:MAG: hypothetical protein Q8P15_00080 [Nanoarchaeota archaeon]|nr:hypothetical protein [Nanoarchaeota archaeon]
MKQETGLGLKVCDKLRLEDQTNALGECGVNGRETYVLDCTSPETCEVYLNYQKGRKNDKTKSM